jgi:hypothetical protein
LSIQDTIGQQGNSLKQIFSEKNIAAKYNDYSGVHTFWSMTGRARKKMRYPSVMTINKTTCNKQGRKRACPVCYVRLPQLRDGNHRVALGLVTGHRDEAVTYLVDLGHDGCRVNAQYLGCIETDLESDSLFLHLL